MALLPAGYARAEHVELRSCHITAASPWASSLYSISVLLDQDSTDGCFFDVKPYRGQKIHAIVVRNGACAPYVEQCASFDLDINFHDTTQPGLPHWAYRGGCTGSGQTQPVCTVPCDATRGEVVAIRGANLDVSVRLVHEPGTCS